MVFHEYSDFGVPATILAQLSASNRLCRRSAISTHSVLINPAESHEKLAQLRRCWRIEQHIEDDLPPLAEVLPSVYNKYPVRLSRLHPCASWGQEMHDLWRFDVKDL